MPEVEGYGGLGGFAGGHLDLTKGYKTYGTLGQAEASERGNEPSTYG